MIKSIITPAEVISLAFSDGGYIPPEAIAEIDIVAATERWVRPVVGEALLERVAEGDYAELRSDYIAPAVAFYTRYLVQPRLNVATSGLGLTSPAGSSHKVAERTSREELQRALKIRARTALKRLSAHLEQNADEYADYTSSENILNHCCCDGGFVQIF